MFIKRQFRGDRLLLSIADNQRMGGKVRQHHLANLGSVPNVNASITDKAAVWNALQAAIERLEIAPEKADQLRQSLQEGGVRQPTGNQIMKQVEADERAQADRDLNAWLRLPTYDDDQEEGEDYEKIEIEVRQQLIRTHKKLLAEAMARRSDKSK